MSLERDLQKALQKNRAALPPTLRLANTAKLVADMRAMERMLDSTKTVADALAQTQDSGRMVADVLARIQDSGKMAADVLTRMQDSGKMAADVLARIQDSGKMAADVLARIQDSGKMVADVLAMTQMPDMAKLSDSLMHVDSLGNAFRSITEGLAGYSPEVTFSDGCLIVDGQQFGSDDIAQIHRDYICGEDGTFAKLEKVWTTLPTPVRFVILTILACLINRVVDYSLMLLFRRRTSERRRFDKSNTKQHLLPQ